MRYLSMEEFQEAEVLWPDEDRAIDVDVDDEPPQLHGARRHTASAPIAIFPPEQGSNVPVTASSSKAHTCRVIGISRDEDGDGEDQTLPPDIVIARRTSGKVACSVCIGNGRTLKGRDLIRFRNHVLRMTGFIERKH